MNIDEQKVKLPFIIDGRATEAAASYRRCQVAREIFVKLDFPLLLEKLPVPFADEKTAGN